MDDDQSQDVLERAILDFTCLAQQLDVIQQKTCLRLSFLEASAMVLRISFRVERKSKSFPWSYTTGIALDATNSVA